MARFDVYINSSKSVPLVLDVQADLLSELATCVVIPLVPESSAQKEVASRLKPVIRIQDKNYILMTTDIAAVTRKSLGVFVVNIEKTHRQDIVEALDFLLQGF